jgi:hypothetical protein
MAAEKKPSGSPALLLFIADPDITRFLRNSEQNLFKHREALKTISAPSNPVAANNRATAAKTENRSC